MAAATLMPNGTPVPEANTLQPNLPESLQNSETLIFETRILLITLVSYTLFCIDLQAQSLAPDTPSHDGK